MDGFRLSVLSNNFLVVCVLVASKVSLLCAIEDDILANMMEVGPYRSASLYPDPYFSVRNRRHFRNFQIFPILQEQGASEELLYSVSRMRPNSLQFALALDTFRNFQTTTIYSMFSCYSLQDQDDANVWNYLPRPAMYSRDEDAVALRGIGVRSWPSPFESQPTSADAGEGHPLSWCLSDPSISDSDLGLSRNWSVIDDSSPDSPLSFQDIRIDLEGLLKRDSPDLAINRLRETFNAFRHTPFQAAGNLLKLELNRSQIGPKVKASLENKVQDQKITEDPEDVVRQPFQEAFGIANDVMFKTLGEAVKESYYRSRWRLADPTTAVQYLLALASGIRGILTDAVPMGIIHRRLGPREVAVGASLRAFLHTVSLIVDLLPLALILRAEMQVADWNGTVGMVSIMSVTPGANNVTNGVVYPPRGHALIIVVGARAIYRTDTQVGLALALLILLTVIRSFFFVRRVTQQILIVRRYYQRTNLKTIDDEAQHFD